MTHGWIIIPALSLLTAALPAGTLADAHHDPAGKPLPPAYRRIVFVGDSITDGHTYPLLIRQALSEAGYEPPVVINAGVASDTATLMLARLDRDVLVHHPTLVTFSAGINDGLRGVPLQAYRDAVTAVADRLKAEKIPMMILTTSILGPKNLAFEKNLAEYNSFLHDFARERGYPVAEVNERQQDERALGHVAIEGDDVHPNYLGQSMMARAVLDALGFKDVPLPKEFKPELMPGILNHWMVRVVPDKSPPLDDKSVLDVRPDATWKPYNLPEPGPIEPWWKEQERARGLALSLDRLIGPGGSYQAAATIESRGPRKVYFNTGAQLHSIWLNGKRIYLNEAWTGWHAGKERVPAELKKGRNTVIIETGPAFFLSVTDDNTW